MGILWWVPVAFEPERGWRMKALLPGDLVRYSLTKRRRKMCVRVFSMFPYVVSQRRGDYSVESLGLPTCLRIVFCCTYRFHANLCAYSCETRHMNCAPWYGKTFHGILKLPTQRSRMNMATVVAVSFVVDVTLVNFEKWFVISTLYWLPFFVFGREPIWWMGMNTSGPVAGNNRSPCCFPLLPATSARFAVLDGSVHVVYHVWPVVMGAPCVVHSPFTWIVCQCRAVALVEGHSTANGWYVCLDCIIYWCHAYWKAVCVQCEVISWFVDYFQ